MRTRNRKFGMMTIAADIPSMDAFSTLKRRVFACLFRQRQKNPTIASLTFCILIIVRANSLVATSASGCMFTCIEMPSTDPCEFIVLSLVQVIT